MNLVQVCQDMSEVDHGVSVFINGMKDMITEELDDVPVSSF